MLILFNRFISDYSTEMIQPVTNELNLDVKVDKLYKWSNDMIKSKHTAPQRPHLKAEIK